MIVVLLTVTCEVKHYHKFHDTVYTVFDLISEHALISEHPPFPETLKKKKNNNNFFFTVTLRYNAPRYNAGRL